MTDSPVTVTPIFDQLVAEFGMLDQPPSAARAKNAAAGTPEDENAEDA